MVLKSIHPPGAAKVVAAITFVFLTAASFTLWLFPTLLLSPQQQFVASLVQDARAGLSCGLILLPVFGTGLAFLSALAGAGMYNVLAPWLGGIRLEVE